MNEAAPFRHVNIATWRVDVERSFDGATYLRPSRPLSEYPARLTDRLDEWAAREPSRIFLAQRDADGEWRNVTHSEFRAAARSVAQALLDRHASIERPVAVLSGNDVEHALIEIGAMYAGVPYSPISP